MEIAVSVFHLFLIFLLARHIWRRETGLKFFFWPSLLFKILTGISLGLLYTHYYPVGDTFSYFRDASFLSTLAFENFPAYVEFLWFSHGLETLPLDLHEPRAVFLTKITSVFCMITDSHYWIISIYFSFTSFLAAWYLVKTIHRNIPSATIPAVIAFLFVPSIVFWSSGLIKESLAVAALYFLTAIFLKRWFGEKLTAASIALAIISLWIFWNLKYYFMAVFFAVACTTLLHKFFTGTRFQRSAGLETIIWVLILFIPLFLVSFLHPNFYPERFFDVIVLNNTIYNQVSAQEDLIHFTNLRAEFWSIFFNAPWALFSGLFRPLFWEAGNFLQLMVSVENTAVLFFFLAALPQAKTYLISPHRLLVLSLLVYVAIVCIFITLSAPNFGTLSRYRTGYLPFFIFLILCNPPILNYLERSFRRLVSQ